jgi:ABC-type dipeptide/oligopeptide/nickel transport systems, permease components
MAKHIVRQFIGLWVTMLLVSLIIYSIFTIIPGDPVTLLTGVSASPEQIEILREKLGLDQNLFERYLTWVKGALTADFGNSIQYNIPVKDLIWDRLIVTSSLGVLSIAIIFCVSFPLGIASAYFNGRILDKLISNGIILGLSIPSYFLGIFIIWLLGITLKLFVPGEFIHYSQNAVQYWKSLFFPALAISIPSICMLAKFIRASILGQIRQDYVRTAKSKGGTQSHIFFKHILRNAIIPIFTFLGMIIADVLAGSIIIEQVFSIPGIGRLLIGGISSRDFPVVITLVVYISFLTIIINFIIELIVRLNDPRIRTV